MYLYTLVYTHSSDTGPPLAPNSVHYILYDTSDLQPGKIKHLVITSFCILIKDYSNKQYLFETTFTDKTRKISVNFDLCAF